MASSSDQSGSQQVVGPVTSADTGRAISPVDPIEKAFEDWAKSPRHKNQKRLSHAQRRDYSDWLKHPGRRPEKGNSKQSNAKFRAHNFYMLIGGQLYRKPGDELDQDADIARANEPRKVIMVEAAYSTIMRTHELIGPHAGVNKIWGEIQRIYYGINKKEVEWALRNCATCSRNKAGKGIAPIQQIKNSLVNERWVIDLVDMRSKRYGPFNWAYHCKVSEILLSRPQQPPGVSSIQGDRI